MTGTPPGNAPAAQADRAQAWRVAFAGLAALAVAMGVGRFAFTPLLPMLLADGSVTLAGGSALATANYLGYLVGAVWCMVVRADAGRMVRLGLCLTVLLTAAMGVPLGSASMPVWIGARFAAGVVSAWVLVHASTWCLSRLDQLGGVRLGGVIYTGPGIGIVLTGLMAGAMLAAGWSSAAGWWSMALLAGVLVALAWTTFAEPASVPQADAVAATPSRTPDRRTLLVALAYGLAGLGYIITATFLPVIARQHLADPLWPDLFWPLFGVSGVLGALLSIRLPLQHDVRWWLALGYLIQAGGIGISLAWPNVAGFALGSLALGLPFTATTLLTMREIRRLHPQGAGPFMGLVTAAFAVGQMIGPPVATALWSDSAGFTPSLLVAMAALCTGAVLWAWQVLAERAGSVTRDRYRA